MQVIYFHILLVGFTTQLSVPFLLSYYLGYHLDGESHLYHITSSSVLASKLVPPAMEQEQANNSAPTTTSGQNSAQNPPTPSSPTILPKDVATNNSPGIHVEPEEKIKSTTTETTALPILSKQPAVVTDDLVNTSLWTNLSRHAITNEMVFGPIPDREYHEGFMRKAIGMAQLALDSDETPVGCVFVRDGEVIGRGINGTNASLNVSTDTLLSGLL